MLRPHRTIVQIPGWGDKAIASASLIGWGKPDIEYGSTHVS